MQDAAVATKTSTSHVVDSDIEAAKVKDQIEKMKKKKIKRKLDQQDEKVSKSVKKRRNTALKDIQNICSKSIPHKEERNTESEWRSSRGRKIKPVKKMSL